MSSETQSGDLDPEQSALVEQFDTQLEDLISQFHARGIRGWLVLSRLAWHLCEVASLCGLSEAFFFQRLRETWPTVLRDQNERRAAGALLIHQPRTRGQA